VLLDDWAAAMSGAKRMTRLELERTVEVLRDLAMATPEGRAAFVQLGLAPAPDTGGSRGRARDGDPTGAPVSPPSYPPPA
jgi:hypothetical protein